MRADFRKSKVERSPIMRTSQTRLLGSAALRLMPCTSKKAAAAAALLVLAPIWIPLVIQKASELPVDYAFGDFSAKQQIKKKEFRVVQRHGGGAKFIKPQRSWKGYLFFPRGSYSTLEITAGAIDSAVLEKRTGLASLIPGQRVCRRSSANRPRRVPDPKAY